MPLPMEADEPAMELLSWSEEPVLAEVDFPDALPPVFEVEAPALGVDDLLVLLFLEEESAPVVEVALFLEPVLLVVPPAAADPEVPEPMLEVVPEMPEALTPEREASELELLPEVPPVPPLEALVPVVPEEDADALVPVFPFEPEEEPRLLLC
ncbi:hypothetical protein [Rufibacter quisquiliarum]|uniref:Uncharacterized protein n=1 Tax=Rufibacter quisquiliarum TaxID=1549639 RepID=A0A839GBH2_9BACT|nr:hypothetical protein [Rufibacter quisquiliarum]MBA9076904.1 hypothetical protein [Rufibacter quisquiliarum]